MPEINTNQPELIEFSVAGQTQQGRQLPALNTRYTGVEERERPDWLHYLYQFAPYIQFFNRTGVTAGNWQGAIPTPEQVTALEQALATGTPLSGELRALVERPDFSAILAFLQMMQYPLEQYWRFTERHQQYYYQDILLFRPDPPQPDKGHLILTLDETETSLTLPGNTQFLGGEDSDGNPLIYQTTDERLLNQAQLDQAYTLTRYPDKELLFLTHCIDTEASITIPDEGRRTFGEPGSVTPDDDLQHYPAIGFRLATPALYLSGGTRTLTLLFQFAEDLDSVSGEMLEQLRIIILTTEGELDLNEEQTWYPPANRQIRLEIILDALFPGIGPADPEDATVPYLDFKIDGRTRHRVQLVQAFNTAKLSQITLDISVEDATGLIASNENGALDTEKPSAPFTYEPRITTAYEFTHPELLVKPIQAAQLNVFWLDQPVNQAAWDTYYEPYLRYRHRNDENPPSDYIWDSNQVEVYHSDKKEKEAGQKKLFSENPEPRNQGAEQLPPHQLEFITAERTTTVPYTELKPDEAIAREWPVWFTLRLSNNDFGHADYAQVVQYQAYLEQAQDAVTAEALAQVTAQQNTADRANLGRSEQHYTESLQLLNTQSTQLDQEIAQNDPAIESALQEAAIPDTSGTSGNDKTASPADNNTNAEKVTTEEDSKEKQPGASATEIALNKASTIANIKLAVWAEIQAGNAQQAQKRANEWMAAQTKMAAETSKNQQASMDGQGAAADEMVVAQATARRAALTDSTQVTKGGAAIELKKVIVQPPYTPTADKITLNYTSQVSFNTKSQTATQQHQLFHIQPLGRPQVNQSDALRMTLLPEFSQLGYLYLGLSNFSTPGRCTLYFQLDSVDGHNINDNPKVRWSYLQGDTWEPFDKTGSQARIIEDSTLRLQDSGLITFDLPEIETQHYIGDNRLWLRFTISEDSVTESAQQAGEPANYSRMRFIAAQGVCVELVGTEIAASHYDQPLPAESITELVEAEPGIVSITQPYPSFAGKPAEDGTALPIRASERLRHKNRALTAWDYEHLVLAAFPELYLTRCFRSEDQATTTLLVVPVNHDPAILQPKVPLYLKQKITDYVKTISPTGHDIQVIDPEYIEIQLKTIVKVDENYDGDKVRVQVSEKINEHMTPWNRGADQSRLLSDQINLAEIAEAIERLDPILGVAKVATHNQSPETGNDTLNTRQIFVPAKQHEVVLMDAETDYIEGIEVWELEYNFVVT